MIDGGVAYCLLCDEKKFFVRNLVGICQCGDGFNFDMAMGTCVEVCGDGITYMLPCDDGNNVNHDGCTDQCAVEDNF